MTNSRRSSILWFCLVTFQACINPNASSVLVADDTGREKAVEAADEFLLECEFGAKKCFYQTNVVLQSAADSALLLECKGIQKRLQDEEGVLETVSWYPKIISDDRVDKTDSPVYARTTVDWTRFFHQGKEYGLFSGDDGLTEIVHLEPKTIRKRFFPQCRCIELYDWPFMFGDLFRRESDTKIAAITLGKHRCFDGTVNRNGKIESIWGLPGKSHFLYYNVFEDGLLTKSEVMFFEKEFSPEIRLPDKNLGISFTMVETKWKKFGDDNVPEKVHVTFRDGFQREQSMTHLTAEILCFNPESKEYQMAYDVRKMLLEQLMPTNPKE